MVTRIEWTYRTADSEPGDNGSRVSVEIFRDGEMLADLSDSFSVGAGLGRPGATTRVATLADGVGSPTTLPATACMTFPDGVRGHLDVRFKVDGRDAWQIRGIASTVVRREFRPVLNTPGDYEWIELPERFDFDGVGVLHADPCDATSILELSY
jgi:hypothetical protein